MSRTGAPAAEDALSLPPERAGRPAPAQTLERRAQTDAAAAAGLFAPPGGWHEDALGGVRALRFDPPGAPRASVIMCHGGGYRMGRPEVDARFCAMLAERCSVEVRAIAYRLAPEHPFPAGLLDALAALDALADRSGDLPLVIAGDSAGGGIAASVGVMSAHGRAPTLAAALLFSPWLDLGVDASSYEANAASDPLFSRASASEAAELYLQGFDPRHPLVSARFADLAGYPPCFVAVGTGEVLREDSTGFAAALDRAGGAVELLEVEGMEHVAVTRSMDLVGARETFDAAASYLDRVLSR